MNIILIPEMFSRRNDSSIRGALGQEDRNARKKTVL